MKKIYTLLLLSLLGMQQFCQGQTPYNKTPEFLKMNSVWVLEQNIGLDFNSGTGVPTYTPRVGQSGDEGAASVCDRNTGDLLFSTDGQTVWGANHLPMPNGTRLFGNGGDFRVWDDTIAGALSTRQGVLIVPFIEDKNKYYIFSLANMSMGPSNKQRYIDNNGDTINGTLFYSVVDMSLNNGLGEVVAGERNILLDSTEFLSEAMIAIPGLCGTIWVIVHTAAPPFSTQPPQYKAYKVSATGVDHSPVVSTGKVHSGRGWLTLSPDGTTIALTGGGRMHPLVGDASMQTFGTGLELAKFNPFTGEIGDVLAIEHFDSAIATPYDAFQYSLSCAFSSDGSKIYVHMFGLFDSLQIRQYDISNYDSTAILNSRNNVVAFSVSNPTTSSYELLHLAYSTFRLYNDTIYIGAHKGGANTPWHISRINNPNALGTACDFESQAILMLPSNRPRSMTLGSEAVLPRSSTTLDTVSITTDTTFCYGISQGTALSPKQTNGMYFIWNDSSTGPTLAISQSGTYWVRYYTEDCRFHSDTFHISEGTLVQPVIRVDEMVLSTALSYATYQWLLDGEVLAGETDSMLYVEVNGDYQVIVTNEQGCIDTSEVYPVNNADIDDLNDLASRIQVWPNPVQDNVFIKSPVPVKLILTSISGKLIQQQTTSNVLSMRALVPGMYLLRITDKDGHLLKVEKLIKKMK